MSNKNTINTTVSRVLFLLLLGSLLFIPNIAYAADIFDTLSTKILKTVRDIRQVVYVVAGFGLIMFAVLAIFNKISFKHLAYICVSLFLLSVLEPFIDYIKKDGQMVTKGSNYGDHTAEASTDGGSNADALVKCEKNNCPSGIDPGKALGAGVPNINPNDLSLAGAEERAAKAAKDAEIAAAAMTCTKGGGTWNASKNKCDKTFAQQLKDWAKTAKSVAKTAQGVASGVNDGIRMYNTIKDAPDRVKKAVNNIGKGGDLGSLFNEVSGAINTVSSTGNQIANSGTTFMSDINKTLDNTSNLATTITGNENNAVSSAIDNSPAKDIIDTAKQATKDVRDDINSVTKPAADITNSGSSTVRSYERTKRSMGL